MRAILNTLSVVFPWHILLIILFPFLIGSFIDYELIEFREIVILLVWAILFTVPFYLTRLKLFYYIIFILLFINGFVNLGHWVMMYSPISASSIFVIFNTTMEEAVGFAGLKSNFLFLWGIPYVVFFVIGLRRAPKLPDSLIKKDYVFASILLLVSIIFIGENALNGRMLRKSTPELVKSIVSFNEEVKEYQKLKDKTIMNDGVVDAKAADVDAKQLVVLIMGESVNRNHMSLYGYDRKTTPNLDNNTEIVVYDNVVSAYSNTLKSIPASLSQAGIENDLKAPSSLNLTQVFKAAGFKTYWLSNQSPLGVWDNIITLFAEQSDVTEFVNVASSTSFESTYRRSYDEKLFKPLIQRLEDKVDKKFIILHLMGSHSTYETRYPSDYELFKDKSNQKEKIISAYDNSIYYNDFVVDSLIKIVEHYCNETQTIGSLVYVSDHGQNVYDEGDYAGHNYSKSIPKPNVEIPFIVWTSDGYQLQFPEQVEQIQANKHYPFVTDDLIYSILDLSRIESSIFMPERSVFNANFNKDRVRILEDGLDYDEK